MRTDSGFGISDSENTLYIIIASSIKRLTGTGIDNPQLDARLLCCHALGLDRAQLLSQSQRVLTKDEIAAIDSMITRREKRESVARIIGKREFWGLDFALNEATLEPRPDSETLVEAVLKRIQDSGFGIREKISILDLGTGTGCLLLSLLHELPQATGVGIDINPRAVEQAQTNAQSLGLDRRAAFKTGSWLTPLSPPPRWEGQGGGSAAETNAERFDIIVSNPPYIPASDITDLMPEVRDHDPLLALDGGEDGINPYRLLIPQLKDFLNPGGIAAFEVGQGQAEQIADLFQQNGFTNTSTHKDLGGINRCVTAFAPNPKS